MVANNTAQEPFKSENKEKSMNKKVCKFSD